MLPVVHRNEVYREDHGVTYGEYDKNLIHIDKIGIVKAMKSVGSTPVTVRCGGKSFSGTVYVIG